uniref:Heat repeat-containing protein 5b-like isoform x2 n=1 Tax=Tetraselmis sp. GSL018 TaxID=582737 RepID=A0A061RPM9_9CHLO
MLAVALLAELLDLLSSDERHFSSDSLKAEVEAGGPGGDPWLIQHLQHLMDLTYKLASGEVEALRVAGLSLMVDVVERFGAAADPEFDGHRLLELYQAQLVSAIRLALSGDAVPMTHGCSLAAAFLEARIHGGDPAVVRQLMRLLLQPVREWDKLQGRGDGNDRYSEWVGVRLRVAVLSAHARCAALVGAAPPAGSAEGAVIESQEELLPTLQDLWLGLLQDNIALGTQSVQALAGYTPALFASASAPVVAAVRPHLAEAWPTVMEGLCAAAPRGREDGPVGAPNGACRLLWACAYGLHSAVQGDDPLSGLRPAGSGSRSAREPPLPAEGGGAAGGAGGAGVGPQAGGLCGAHSRPTPTGPPAPGLGRGMRRPRAAWTDPRGPRLLREHPREPRQVPPLRRRRQLRLERGAGCRGGVPHGGGPERPVGGARRGGRNGRNGATRWARRRG